MNAPLAHEQAMLALSAMQRAAHAGEALRLRRLAALAEAIRHRKAFFAIKHRYDADPWVWGQYGWGDDGERNTDEELERIREDWREALWGMNRHVY